jgi:hypothetical protein
MFAIVLLLGAIPIMAATLPAPVKLDAEMAGFTKIVLKWHSMDGAVSYKVYCNDKVGFPVCLLNFNNRQESLPY